MAERAQILVKGIVQGVGFRPFVFNLAETHELKGFVTNTHDGVLIDVEGSRIQEFIQQLRTTAPPLSQITDLDVTPLPLHGYPDFTIHQSQEQTDGRLFTLVSPDVSLCENCLREMLDPADRRFLYPFINCTNCGPRYSITRSIPYDRPNTTMADFTMCPACKKEYDDPRNRRFHAQPNACPACGPTVEFRVRGSEFGVRNDEALREAITLLRKGGIVAIKGLGGFHLACDASNDRAVRRLRENKRKSNKPFAVMSSSIEDIGRYCEISPEERDLLTSVRRPVVLLQKKAGSNLSEAVSPNNRYVGVMLPYTPLHQLLFSQPIALGSIVTQSHFNALVMTSGNLSEEPIVRDNNEAVKKLSGMVDGFLFHNRDIFMRVDDSVIRIADCRLRIAEQTSKAVSIGSKNSEFRNPQSEISFIRRSRGYAPDPIELHDDGPEVLGCGADLKNTFTLTKGKFAIPSQHIGDMENYETVTFYEECLANLKTVYRADPKVIVHDLHPGYMSTRWAKELGSRVKGQGDENSRPRTPTSELALYGIQHHYAHIGSVMAEHGLDRKVIGVAFDGTGFGIDGNLWGGEFLLADCDGFERVGQIRYVPLPGGDAAIRDPWKTAVSYIAAGNGENTEKILSDIGFTQKYGKQTIDQVLSVARSRELSPLSSGAGRLFDAVSALVGVCDHNTFEGEAAIALESLARTGNDDQYVVELKQESSYTVVDFTATISGIIRDMGRSITREIISTKFHNTIAGIILNVVRKIKLQSGITEVALSGGTFQNLYLLNRTINLLSRDGFQAYTNQKVPCNDAGISLGQAYLVRQRLKRAGVGVRS